MSKNFVYVPKVRVRVVRGKNIKFFMGVYDIKQKSTGGLTYYGQTTLTNPRG
jgi:hypothetical protein